jgi:hypothetical protein
MTDLLSLIGIGFGPFLANVDSLLSEYRHTREWNASRRSNRSVDVTRRGLSGGSKP